MAALRRAGMSPAPAQSCARALVLADQEGLPSHGLSRLPFYLDQMATGKVDARAVPNIE